ncbi:PTS transporter subunit EIIC [Bacillus songklensis]|uniref:PTS system mannitol-specific EIICB component n=1 Tax=Bacillus songklensis TaxID=1069116 RepID=A0ABV8AVW4_9BACI
MRKVGQLLSAIVYQNIAVIIVVGLIRELFGIYGFYYNDRILLLVNPIYETLLPILLAYTGGRLTGGQRGAVVASIVTYGLTLASSVPIIIGAMVIGPLTGWIIYRVDKLLKQRIPIGYELLISNIVTAMIGIVLTIACFLYVGQTLSTGVKWVIALLQKGIYWGWLPAASLFIEPGKVLFFNNALNYGMLTPLGIQQAKDLGKSIFFLLESNPGPGLGILTAYWLKTNKAKKKVVTLSIFIHFIGGIHEIYFPYVLRRMRLVLALIVGGLIGNSFFQWYGVGLVSLPSPGSILLIAALAPSSDLSYVLIGIFLSGFVSFFIAYLLLDRKVVNDSNVDYEQQMAEIHQLQHLDHIRHLVEQDDSGSKGEQAIHPTFRKPVNYILFVCEAGMGSSAMGAAMLRKKLKEANLSTIQVDNASVNEIPQEADFIICHRQLKNIVMNISPEKTCYCLDSFTDFHEYDAIVAIVKESQTNGHSFEEGSVR